MQEKPHTRRNKYLNTDRKQVEHSNTHTHTHTHTHTRQRILFRIIKINTAWVAGEVVA